jgi:hypothetical protein
VGPGVKVAAVTVAGMITVAVISPLAVGLAGAEAAIMCQNGTTHADAAVAGLPRVPVVFGYSVSLSGDTARFSAVNPAGATTDGQWVQATAAGQVTAVSGSQVTIRLGDGTLTGYSHLAEVTVSFGDRVAAGQLLGRGAGAGPDFTVISQGAAVNPVTWFQTQGVQLTGSLPTDPVIADFTPVGLPPTVMVLTGDAEGGLAGFPLPAPGDPRRASVTTAPSPIPPTMLGYYRGAADRYQIPWVLLAGIGMEETGHWRTRHASSAGAQGAMQFMPATFRTEGVDGDGDGRIDILNPADSVHSAARYLVDSGVRQGPDGVRKALLTYNHADWYVNDVLYYAAAYAAQYGAGTSIVTTGGCPATADAGQVLPPATPDQIKTVLEFAVAQSGKPYLMGGTGPDVWDCSGLPQAAYALIGITLPRTAAAQRDWLATGHGTRIPPGHEQPGDMIFWDSYLGPRTIGHVVIVLDPQSRTTIEAHDRADGVGSFSYAGKQETHTIFEIWRPAP